MIPLEKSRAICYGFGGSYAKDAQVARLREDFARHFRDSIDYEPETKINDVLQPLIVSVNKNDCNKKNIIAYPGETFHTGDIVDCYNAKWLITEVDQNRQVYTSGQMQRCNRQLIWQNPKTREIHSRWVTVEKPYYYNTDQREILTVSTREFKVQVAYDDETSLIDMDKRFMLEIIGDLPRTYKVTSVDSMTERYHEAGIIHGFIVLNVMQDLYNPLTDDKDLMVCDYIPPSKNEEASTPPSSHIGFSYSGPAAIRQGGSRKRFEAILYKEGQPDTGTSLDISVKIPSPYDDKIIYAIEGNTVALQALDFVELQGQMVTISASYHAENEDIVNELVIEVNS